MSTRLRGDCQSHLLHHKIPTHSETIAGWSKSIPTYFLFFILIRHAYTYVIAVANQPADLEIIF